jgi:hypothetical protein
VAKISEPSIKSLFVSSRCNGSVLSTATGFVAVHNGAHYLITNWHVVAGRHPSDGHVLSTTNAIPDELEIVHNCAGQLGRWLSIVEPLYDQDGDPFWLEHPTHGHFVDVVALPLTQTNGVQIYPYDPTEQSDSQIAFGPSESLSVVGFPFGLTGGGALGIWVQGTVATEPDIDYQDVPCLLIDSRTREGQSGSPVILFRTGAYTNEQGTTVVGAGRNGTLYRRLLGAHQQGIGSRLCLEGKRVGGHPQRATEGTIAYGRERLALIRRTPVLRFTSTGRSISLPVSTFRKVAIPSRISTSS